MKNIIIAVALTGVFGTVLADEVAAPRTKEVCHDVMGKDYKPVKNKDGSVKQQCKTIKVHKKHEGTEIPPKK